MDVAIIATVIIIEAVSDSTNAIIKRVLSDENCNCPKCVSYRTQRKPSAPEPMPTGFSKW
jgi:hypothetical protein